MPRPTAAPGRARPFQSQRRRLDADGAKRDLRWSLTIVAAASILGVAVGYSSFQPDAVGSGAAVFALAGDGTSVFLQIAGRNLAATGLLLSGYVTLGATTLLGVLFTSGWIGSTVHAVQAAAGWGTVSPWVVSYLPLEFGGLMVAATAGLLVLTSLVRAATVGRPLDRDHLPGQFLRLAAAAVALISIGAAAETLLILAQR